jgi:hypothetical protein
MKKGIPLLALCAFLLALAAGCAAPGVPMPPSLRLPTVVDSLSAVRKGNRVMLTWSPPTETTDRQAIHWPTVTRICRVVNQFPINACGLPVKEIKSTELASVAPGGRKPMVSFEDVLPAALIATQNQATYVIQVLNQSGHSAGLSNQVRVPLAPAVPPPSNFRVSLDAQGPLLEWRVAALQAQLPGVSHVLRIYRREHGKPDFVLISEEPYRTGEGEARDSSFEWEHEYEYKVDTVTMLSAPGKSPVEVEGDDSEIVSLLAHDVFPPAVPGGLQAVYSSVGQKPFIDLTWAPNMESDLAGYIVYRHTVGNDFVAVTKTPVKAPAWRDNDVRPGEKYYYAVSAIDLRGNQSARSATAEETAPLEVR